MESGGLVELLLLVGLVLVHAFIAATEAALSHVSRGQMQELKSEGVRWAELAGQLAEDSLPLITTVYLSTILIQFTTAAFAVLAFVPPLSEIIAPLFGVGSVAVLLSVMLIVLLLALIMLVFGQLIPRSLALRNPEGVALRVAPAFRALLWFFSPVIKVLSLLSPLAESLSGSEHPGVGVPFVTEERIKEWVDAGEEGGVIEAGEKSMIFSIFELGDTLAREIMVPRIDVRALDVTVPLDEALALVLEKGFSRIPIYRETIDDVVGLLYAKDLLRYLREEAATGDLTTLLRPAYFVPESKALDELLQELQQQKIHMAIVVDEYGGMAGVVTIEDIIEEIVGEIQDEYDSEEPFVQLMSEKEAVFNARIDLDDLNKLLGADLPTDEADTLGGLIYTLLGKVPAVGDTIRVDGFRIEVMAVSGRRIKKVRLVRLPLQQREVTVTEPVVEALVEKEAS